MARTPMWHKTDRHLLCRWQRGFRVQIRIQLGLKALCCLYTVDGELQCTVQIKTGCAVPLR